VSKALDKLLTKFGDDRNAVENGEKARAVEWTIWDLEQTLPVREAPKRQVSNEEGDKEPPPDDD
jgi:hypothetical protein